MSGSSSPGSEPTLIPAGIAAPLPQGVSGTALPIGTTVHEFRIDGLIGQGGFGIVYLAHDESLERMIALKEYMPAELAERETGTTTVRIRSQHYADTFAAGLRSFINEAKLLAQFDHPSLVKVHRFFTGNGTAYMVMPYYNGITLKEALRAMSDVPDERWVRALIGELLGALDVIHAASCYHRDISPDNILMLENRKPLLLDFGAARRAIGNLTRAFTVILKPGYAPIEQYADDPAVKQGPWTDLYALASVAHFALTGEAPQPSAARASHDRLMPLSQRLQGRYTPALLKALDVALAFRPQDRPQNVSEFRALMEAGRSTPASTWRGSRPPRGETEDGAESAGALLDPAPFQLEIVPAVAPVEYHDTRHSNFETASKLGRRKRVWHLSIVAAITGAIALAAIIIGMRAKDIRPEASLNQASGTGVGGAPASAERAERPVLHVGDTWSYRSFDAATGTPRGSSTHVLAALEKDKIVIQAGPEIRTYTRDFNLTEVKRGETVVASYSPAWRSFSFPIEVGRKWDASFTSISRGEARTIRWAWTARVEGKETLSVPAGTFETFRIRIRGTYSGREGAKSWEGTRDETIWYAPAAKRHVKSEFEESSPGYHKLERVELLSFKAAN